MEKKEKKESKAHPFIISMDSYIVNALLKKKQKEKKTTIVCSSWMHNM